MTSISFVFPRDKVPAKFDRLVRGAIEKLGWMASEVVIKETVTTVVESFKEHDSRVLESEKKAAEARSKFRKELEQFYETVHAKFRGETAKCALYTELKEWAETGRFPVESAMDTAEFIAWCESAGMEIPKAPVTPKNAPRRKTTRVVSAVEYAIDFASQAPYKDEKELVVSSFSKLCLDVIEAEGFARDGMIYMVIDGKRYDYGVNLKNGFLISPKARDIVFLDSISYDIEDNERRNAARIKELECEVVNLTENLVSSKQLTEHYKKISGIEKGYAEKYIKESWLNSRLFKDTLNAAASTHRVTKQEIIDIMKRKYSSEYFDEESEIESRKLLSMLDDLK